jgi:hypothetical protein
MWPETTNELLPLFPAFTGSPNQTFTAMAGPGQRLNDHLEHEHGEIVFRHACEFRLNILSKRQGLPTVPAARPTDSR